MDIKGETHSYASKAGSGALIARYFCPDCGSHLFCTSNTPEKIIGVSAGTLDDSSWFKADFIVYQKHKPSWDLMDASIKAFEGMPSSH